MWFDRTTPLALDFSCKTTRLQVCFLLNLQSNYELKNWELLNLADLVKTMHDCGIFEQNQLLFVKETPNGCGVTSIQLCG